MTPSTRPPKPGGQGTPPPAQPPNPDRESTSSPSPPLNPDRESTSSLCPPLNPDRESTSSPCPPLNPDRESTSQPSDGHRDVVRELREQAERAISRQRSNRAVPEVVVRGTLRRAEVETRPLVLAADDGTTWELLFPSSWRVEVEEGARVTVHGDRATDVMTTTMVGPVLRVRTLSKD
jgi:hypothetical protein